MNQRRAIRSGVISDTHGRFDPAFRRHFTGVDHILHAEDIGDRSVIEQLEQIVPVTAQSFPVNAPHLRCWLWKTGEHKEQDSARLTVDGRTLTIREPIHKLLTAYRHVFLKFLQKE
ncbi:MAG: hypothetical protein JJE16_02720 [Nitrospiraceae bacterium]|nr:hypothetical protein [Nitrospiraceae bacterium]